MSIEIRRENAGAFCASQLRRYKSDESIWTYEMPFVWQRIRNRQFVQALQEINLPKM